MRLRPLVAPTILVVATLFQPSTILAQEAVLPGMPAHLQIVASWNPDVDITSDTLELTPTDVIPFGEQLLVATLGGTIRAIANNELVDRPVLTHAQSGLELQQESGMTGIALHPNFDGHDPNGFGRNKLYTITTENSALNGGLPGQQVDFAFADEVHQDVIREWDIGTLLDDQPLDVSQSREILRVAQPGPFHNIVDLTFDESGELYITSGDGGNSRDNASTNASRMQTSQDLSTIYGNILRINPDPDAHELVRVSESTGEPAYSIAPTNPFANDDAVEAKDASTLAEIYAFGLRSPFRIGRDPEVGTILIGDVGERTREEISVIERGGNYGWGRFEGTLEANPAIELNDTAEHSPPVFEYGRDVGFSAIGGTVYRGQAIPELHGKYVFADFGQATDTARLFYGSIDPLDDDLGHIREFDLSTSPATFDVSIDDDAIPDTVAPLPDRIFGIAADNEGELVLIGGPDPRAGVPTAPGAFVIRLGPDLRCDIVPNRTCDVEDLSALTLALARGEDGARYDVDWNGSVDSEDIGAWLADVGKRDGEVYLRGDANLDGRVDVRDFLQLSQAFGMSTTSWDQGNFNGDFAGTNVEDFLILSRNFNMSSPNGEEGTVANVPEPACYVAWWFLVISLLLRNQAAPAKPADRI